ncbi:MAG: 30S ribosomal protein S6 [Bdellovibrionaceae bacterium]|nr:30S ribosomal protein S6 [Pseudobdellovibrionaceae bacterium]
MQLSERVNLRPYEGVVIMHPDSSEEEQKALFRRNKTIIESFAGEVKHLDTWGKRTLSNPIDGLKKAVYFHTTFQAKPEAIAELERTMRINDRVVRYMHTRLEEGTDLSTHLENFKKALADSAAREREREAKFQARRAAQGARGPRREEGGFRRDDGGGFRRGDRGGDDAMGDDGEEG